MYNAEVVIKLHMHMPKILCGNVCDVSATVHGKFTHRHTSCGAAHTHLQALTHQTLQHQNSVWCELQELIFAASDSPACPLQLFSQMQQLDRKALSCTGGSKTSNLRKPCEAAQAVRSRAKPCEAARSRVKPHEAARSRVKPQISPAEHPPTC